MVILRIEHSSVVTGKIFFTILEGKFSLEIFNSILEIFNPIFFVRSFICSFVRSFIPSFIH